MTMRAYILVTVGPGKARDVAKKIATVPGVKLADACWGDPDIYVVAEVGSAEELNKMVMDRIQTIEGVARTSTHIAIG
jgi:DNA-binding Lrp family transcriptional regulator